MNSTDGDVWISDMTRCRPADAVSADGRHGTWIAVDYEIERGAGVMLYGTPGREPPPIRLPLNVNGWHAIFVGVHYGAGPGFVAERTLQLKLSSDAAFARIMHEGIRPEKDGNYPEKVIRIDHISEAFWKAADLTGQDIIVAAPYAASGLDERDFPAYSMGAAAGRESNIAYVRLVPLDDAARASLERERPRADTRRLIANYDGWNLVQWNVHTPEDFVAEFDCLRDSDFDIALYAMAYGPIAFYPTRVAEPAESCGAYGIGAAVRRLAERGIDPLRQAIVAARGCGVKLFPQCRFEGTQYPTQHVRRHHGGRLMADHPEWLARYPDGAPTRHLSLAYAGVRQFYVRFFREWVEDYEADGINVLFSRSYPFAYYEQPVCERYREAYGADMTRVPQDDRRTWAARSHFVTQFLRELRAMLDDVGRRQGRYIPNCYLVPHGNPQAGFPGTVEGRSFDEPLHAALDVETWVREGLVDYLVLHLHVYREHDGSPYRDLVEAYARLAEGTRTRIVADIYPRRQPPRQYRKIAMTYYDAGADGLAFWDSFTRYYRASEWAFIKRLGHRDELDLWEGKGDDYFRQVPLQSHDGNPMGAGRYFARPTDG